MKKKMVKKTRIIRRKLHLENLVINGDAPYCKKHKEDITIKNIYKNRCYTGNHGRSYCKYLELK